MTFASPIFLLALLLVPLAVAAYLLVQRRRARYAVRFTNVDLLANLAPKRPAWRRHVPPILYLAAIGTALAFVTLTRLLRELPAVTMSFLSLLLPFGALAFGALIEGEPLTVAELLGAALVAAGIAVAQLPVGALLRYALYRFMQGIILIHPRVSVRNLTVLLRQVIVTTAQRLTSYRLRPSVSSTNAQTPHGSHRPLLVHVRHNSNDFNREKKEKVLRT